MNESLSLPTERIDLILAIVNKWVYLVSSNEALALTESKMNWNNIYDKT